MAPTLSTGTAPYRSAIAPATGWAAPHSSICIASASANTSRPQPNVLDIGVRKNARPERGPKPSTPIRQPHTRMTAGVRQDFVCQDIVCEDVLCEDTGRKDAGSRTSDEAVLLSSCTVVSRPFSLRSRLRPEPQPAAAPASPRSAG